MTVKNISKDFSRTKHMVFVEFLEFICRIAYASPIEVNYDYDSNQSDEGGLKPGKQPILMAQPSLYNVYSDKKKD